MEILPSQFVCTKRPSSFSRSCGLFLFNQQTLVSFSHRHCNLFSQKSQIQKSITCARNKRRRQFGSARSRKLMIDSAYYIASKLKILPEPLDLLMQEFGIGGGNGGGFGFWKGSGWGGFDGWGRRRIRKRELEVWGILVILGLGLWFILGKEFDCDVFLGFLGLILFGLSVDGWRSGVKDWALGFSCCAVVGGLILKRVDFQRWIKSFGAIKLNKRRKSRAF